MKKILLSCALSSILLTGIASANAVNHSQYDISVKNNSIKGLIVKVVDTDVASTATLLPTFTFYVKALKSGGFTGTLPAHYQVSFCWTDKPYANDQDCNYTDVYAETVCPYNNPTYLEVFGHGGILNNIDAKYPLGMYCH